MNQLQTLYKIRDIVDLDSVSKGVLFHIALRGTSWESSRAIAKYVGAGHATVARRLKELIELGVVDRLGKRKRLSREFEEWLSMGPVLSHRETNGDSVLSQGETVCLRVRQFVSQGDSLSQSETHKKKDKGEKEEENKDRKGPERPAIDYSPHPPHIEGLIQLSTQPADVDMVTAVGQLFDYLAGRETGYISAMLEGMGLRPAVVASDGRDIREAFEEVALIPGHSKFADAIGSALVKGIDAQSIKEKVPPWLKKNRDGELVYPSVIIANWKNIRAVEGSSPAAVGGEF